MMNNGKPKVTGFYLETAFGRIPLTQDMVDDADMRVNSETGEVSTLGSRWIAEQFNKIIEPFKPPTDFASTIFGRPAPCFVMTPVGDREVAISLDTFRRMKPGVEYDFGLESNIVVRREGDQLFGRKLQTFAKLSELDS